MTDPAKPKLGQQTTQQNATLGGLGYFGYPDFGAGLVSFGAFAGASSLAGGCIGGAYGLWGDLAATVGTGVLEGANKYGASPMGCGIGSGGLAGFGPPLPGTYFNYRIMAGHPTLALAMCATAMPVLGAEWSYTADEDAPADAKDFIERVFKPLRFDLMRNCIKAAMFGSQAFERVYQADAGAIVLQKLKPLLPELTQYLVGKDGSFAGLMNSSVSLAADKCWVYTHDQDGDNYYGRSRMENCRRAWSNWLATDDNAARMARRTTSIIPRVMYPPGSGPDEKGTVVTNLSLARTVMLGMTNGQGVLAPNFGAMDYDDLRGSPDMAKQSLWDIDVLDMGNPGPFIAALMAQQAYYDKLMVRGWFKAERSLLEAQTGGSRADSESHSDIGLSDCSTLLDDVIRTINGTLVDDLLEINYGAKARGTVRIEPTPIIDAEKEVDQAILAGIAGNAPLFIKLMGEMDLESFFKRRGIPIKPTIEPNNDGWDKVQAEVNAAEQAKAPKPGDLPGGQALKGDTANMSHEDETANRILKWISGETLDLSSEELTGGEWRTINGAKVYIKGGSVVAGPSHLMGLKEDEVHSVHESHTQLHAEIQKKAKGLLGQAESHATVPTDKFYPHMQDGHEAEDWESYKSELRDAANGNPSQKMIGHLNVYGDSLNRSIEDFASEKVAERKAASTVRVAHDKGSGYPKFKEADKGDLAKWEKPGHIVITEKTRVRVGGEFDDSGPSGQFNDVTVKSKKIGARLEEGTVKSRRMVQYSDGRQETHYLVKPHSAKERAEFEKDKAASSHQQAIVDAESSLRINSDFLTNEQHAAERNRIEKMKADGPLK